MKTSSIILAALALTVLAALACGGSDTPAPESPTDVTGNALPTRIPTYPVPIGSDAVGGILLMSETDIKLRLEIFCPYIIHIFEEPSYSGVRRAMLLQDEARYHGYGEDWIDWIVYQCTGIPEDSIWGPPRFWDD